VEQKNGKRGKKLRKKRVEVRMNVSEEGGVERGWVARGRDEGIVRVKVKG